MITTFVNYCRYNKGYSERTCQEYGKDMRMIATWIKSNSQVKRWRELTKADVDTMVQMWSSEGLQSATIKRRVSTLRTFYQVARELGANIENPAKYVSTPKGGKKVVNTIEMAAVAAALNDSTNDAETKRAIAMMTETGMRLGEFLTVSLDDVDFAERRIRVHGKGNKERYVYYGEATAEQLRTMKSKQIAESCEREVRRKVHFALAKYDHGRQQSPHTLRHTFATQMLANGGELTVLSKLMGHEQIETTKRYLEVSDVRAAAQYRQFGVKIG